MIFNKNTATLLICLMAFTFTSNAQEIRQTLNFNSHWDFKKTKDTLNKEIAWEKLTLPHTWNAVDMQMGKDFYEGEGIYKKAYTFASNLKNKRIFIKFEGAGQVADLYVNGKLVGSHKGGYSAFCFDISHHVKLGQSNELMVKVNNKARKDIIPVNHFLFGIYGGIYRPVELIITNQINISTTDYASPGVYISQKKVDQNIAEINIATKVENITGLPQEIEITNTIYNKDGKQVIAKTSKQVLSAMGRQEISQDISLPNPILWQGIENPYLYKIKTAIVKDGQVMDEVYQPLGLRKIELVAGKGVFLNNKPYKMYGVSRHQDRWGVGSALSNEQHAEDLKIIEEMGASTIRLAHYQQANYMYAKADSIGFLVWAEIPFVNTFTREESDNAKQQLEELIKQNYNHPSIYIWGLHNEVYGKTPGDYPAVLTRDLNDLAERLDPYRYTAAVSGYEEMNRPTNLNAQVQGINPYFGWYDGAVGDLQRWATGMAKDYPKNLLILSEYGADGNVFQQQEQATLPNSWDYTSPFYPENFATKTHEIQWPIIANNPNILASYVWNMFDFATPMWNRGSLIARNMKGLVTFDRKLKKDVFYFYKASWSKQPVLYITERRTTSRKNQITPITIYCNQGTPILWVNGKKVNTKPNNTSINIKYTFENISLQKGKNVIKAQVGEGKNKLTDEIIWNF